MTRLFAPCVHALLGTVLVVVFAVTLRAEYFAGALPLARFGGFAVAAAAWTAGWMLLVVEEVSRLRRGTGEAGQPPLPTDSVLGLDDTRILGVAVCVYGVVALIASIA